VLEGSWCNKGAAAQVSGQTRYTRPVNILPVLREKMTRDEKQEGEIEQVAERRSFPSS